MKFLTLALIVFPSAVMGYQVSYDTIYDKSTNSLDTVACSDGSNGLLTKGYKTYGDLPKFPFIGGAQAIADYNSNNCGTCWNITYQNTSIAMLAIDHTDDGFNLSLEAMNNLTHGQGVHLGLVSATATRVNASVCGL